MIDEIKEFVAERDAALRSLDEPTIRAFAAKYKAEVSSNSKVFWASVHKSRLSIVHFTEEEKAVSREWLAQNGFVPEGL